MARVHQFSLFQTRRFWPLFSVQFLGALNDHVFKNAFMALLTYRLADEMGLNIDLHSLAAGAIYILPFALLAPTAGQIADGMDKAAMMRRVKLVEIVLMVLAAIAYQTRSIELLYVLLFLMGAQSAFFAPIKYGVLPQYLKRDELVPGNGLVQAATFLAIIIGQIAGIKLVLSPSGVTIVSVAVVVLAVVGYLAATKAPPAPPLGPAPKVDLTFVRSVYWIIRDCARHGTPFFALMLIMWFWFTGAAFMSLILPLAKGTLHASEDAALVMLGLFTVGLAIGALLTNRVVGGRISFGVSHWGAIGIAVGSVLFYLAVSGYGAGIDREGALLNVADFIARPDAWRVMGGFFVIAVFAGLYVTPLNVVYQATCPPDQRGRYVACSNVVDSLAMVASALVAMVMIQSGVNREEIFAIFGLTGLIAAWFSWRRHRTQPVTADQITLLS